MLRCILIESNFSSTRTRLIDTVLAEQTKVLLEKKRNVSLLASSPRHQQLCHHCCCSRMAAPSQGPQAESRANTTKQMFQITKQAPNKWISPWVLPHPSNSSLSCRLFTIGLNIAGKTKNANDLHKGKPCLRFSLTLDLTVPVNDVNDW